jgi:hypothetical protein
MLVVRFPDGGNLSIEFTTDAPDAGNSVTSCDLRIFMDQASEPVAA